MDYLLLILATVLLAVNFVVNNLYQQKQGTSMQAGLRFNALLGACTAVIFFIGSGFRCGWNLYSFSMAAMMTLFSTVYTIIGFVIMKQGKMSLYTLFLMAGGMVVPFLWGILFLNEPFSMLQFVGLVFISTALGINNVGAEGMDMKTLLLCMIVFFLNGFVSVVSKVHQISPLAVSSHDFVTLTGIIKCIACTIVLLPLRNHADRDVNTEEKKGKRISVFF